MESTFARMRQEELFIQLQLKESNVDGYARERHAKVWGVETSSKCSEEGAIEQSSWACNKVADKVISIDDSASTTSTFSGSFSGSSEDDEYFCFAVPPM